MHPATPAGPAPSATHATSESVRDAIRLPGALASGAAAGSKATTSSTRNGNCAPENDTNEIRLYLACADAAGSDEASMCWARSALT